MSTILSGSDSAAATRRECAKAAAYVNLLKIMVRTKNGNGRGNYVRSDFVFVFVVLLMSLLILTSFSAFQTTISAALT